MGHTPQLKEEGDTLIQEQALSILLRLSDFTDQSETKPNQQWRFNIRGVHYGTSHIEYDGEGGAIVFLKQV